MARAPSDALYLTDGQVAQRLGVDLKDWRAIVAVLEKEGFPRPDPLFANRRYWPACRAFLDRRHQMGQQSPSGIPALDGEERWNEDQRPAKRRA